MQARWVIWIAGGVLGIACVVLFVLPKPGTIGAQVIGKTNDAYTVVITNSTWLSAYVRVRPEIQENGGWDEVGVTSRGFFRLDPQEAATAEVSFVATNVPRRIAVSYVQIDDGQLAHWIGTARSLMGFQRNPARFLYIAVE